MPNLQGSSQNISPQGNPVFKAFSVDFNQHVRFMYIISRLRLLSKHSKNHISKFSILDLGAGPGTLNNYLLRERTICRVFNVEINSSNKIENLVVADGSRLPFQDDSFDFLVSSDVLEHVVSHRRDDFVSELLRCGKYGLVITYSKLHKNHVSQGGIKVFEKTWGSHFPSWYLEHNMHKVVDDNALVSVLEQNGCQFIELKPLVGVFSLFFTGLECRMPVKMLSILSNIIAYLTTRLIDPLKVYGFGVTALKRNL